MTRYRNGVWPCKPYAVFIYQWHRKVKRPYLIGGACGGGGGSGRDDCDITITAIAWHEAHTHRTHPPGVFISLPHEKHCIA